MLNVEAATTFISQSFTFSIILYFQYFVDIHKKQAGFYLANDLLSV